MSVDFGLDLACMTDLSPTMAETASMVTLAQALVRMVTTPRGSVVDAPNWGIDVTAYVDGPMDARGAQKVASLMDAQFRQDDRVLRSSTQATWNASTETLRTVSAIITSNGPIRLTLDISNVTVALLESGA